METPDTGEEVIQISMMDEVKQAIGVQRNNKARIDKLTSELFKAGEVYITAEIHALISKIWTEDRIPEDWRPGIICPIYKPSCKDYRESFRKYTHRKN